MNKKGFTLVELLAVIIILALLALLTSTAVTKLVRDSKEDLSNTQMKLIESAAKSWGAENLMKLPSSGDCSYLTLKDLKEYGLIDSSVLDPETSQELSDDLKIKISTTITKQNTLATTYEVNPESVNGCTGIYNTICRPVETATTGNIPLGKFEKGDEYLCEVAPGRNYTFFVLSTKGDKVNLIMDSNVNPNGEPVKAEGETKAHSSWNSTLADGPLAAITYLNNATSSWTNIVNLNETYDDEGLHFTDFALTGKARMPKLSEVEAVECGLENNANCPLWVVNYLQTLATKYPTATQITSIFGYWLLSSVNLDSYTNCAWDISFIGGATADQAITGYRGVRPVITVSKLNIIIN